MGESRRQALDVSLARVLAGAGRARTLSTCLTLKTPSSVRGWLILEERLAEVERALDGYAALVTERDELRRAIDDLRSQPARRRAKRDAGAAPRYDDAALIAAIRRCAVDYTADSRAGRLGPRAKGRTPSATYYVEWRERQPDRGQLPSPALFMRRGDGKWNTWTARAGFEPNPGRREYRK